MLEPFQFHQDLLSRVGRPRGFSSRELLLVDGSWCYVSPHRQGLDSSVTVLQGLTKEEANEAWDDIHKLLAPYVYESIVSVSGMWIKIGQYLSSRADVMPQPYLNEL